MSTETFLGVVTLALFGWEAYKLAADGKTISEVVWQVCKNRPYVLFFAGLLCGHLFWCPCEIR